MIVLDSECHLKTLLLSHITQICIPPSVMYVYVFRLVVGVLKEVEGERRCFRLVGGVLVERSVKEVLPALEHNNQQVNDPLMLSF